MLTLISLLSFLLPTQLALHVNSLSSVVYGFRIDYLIPTLYLTDIVVLLIIVLGFKNIKFNRKHIVYCILYIGFAVSNILISSYLVPSAYRWIRVTEMIVLGLVIINTKKFDVFRNFVKPLSYSVFIASILGILQFLKGGSIGGFFYYFGERAFAFGAPNIASYPYSFFSHPNSFAGFLLVFSIFLLEFKKKFRQKYFWTLFILVIINLILTSSLNVYITIAMLLLIKFNKVKSLSLILIDFNARYIVHRLELIKSALIMIKENFWYGVGLNNFIPNLVKVSNTYLNSWELQPVHNIFLLLFSELGIIGLIMFLFLLSTLTFNYQLIAILITGLNDHYWLTLQQNILLFVFTLIIARKNKKNHI